MVFSSGPLRSEGEFWGETEARTATQVNTSGKENRAAEGHRKKQAVTLVG